MAAERAFKVLVYRQAAGEQARLRAADLDFDVHARTVDGAATLAREHLSASKLAVRAINHAPGDVIRATVYGPSEGAPGTIVARLATATRRVR
jgi:hypothetical protein